MRATLCFLYLKCERYEKAKMLASELPHMRESREIIEPVIAQNLSGDKIGEQIKAILLGE